MRILVTGGAGFIGSNFVKKCISSQFSAIESVIVLDSLTYAGTLTNFTALELKQFEFVNGDIRDLNLVNSLISRVNAVVNFAAESHVDRSIDGSTEFISTNIIGTHNLLEAVRKQENVRFLQVSTDEVYGSISEGAWSENEPLLPNSPYSASKASADLLVRSYFRTHGLDVITTRCSNNYGPNQYPEKIIPLFVTNLIDDLKIPVYGDGMNSRDWLHVDDHCFGIYLALTSGKSGEIYNIGGGTELSNLDLTSTILQYLGKDDTYIKYVSDRKGHDLRYSVNINKISKELGYTPKKNFAEYLPETIEWYIKNEKWWRPLKK